MNQTETLQIKTPMHKEAAWKEFDKWKKHQMLTQEQPSLRYNSKICFYCNKGWGKGRKRTRQHLLPKRRGGLYETDNLRWCCNLCNHLLSLVDDCPVILNVYKEIIAKTPLRYLPSKTAFAIYVAMQNDTTNATVRNLLDTLVENLKHDKDKYVARKILMYMKLAFPGVIRTMLPKEEIPIIFPKK